MSNPYLTIDPLGEATSTRRYQIQEKLFSLRDSYKIKDESGKDVFIVRQKLLTLGDKLTIEDMNGNVLIRIGEELLHLHPTYKIISAHDVESNRQLAVIQKKFTLRERFAIDSALGEYILEALDLAARSFTLTKNGRTVAVINRKYFSLDNAYGVEVDGEEDHAFIIALVIVTNQCFYY